MSETLEEVDEIAKTIPEVAPPGWGHTVAKKEKTKPNKPKSKIGGTAHEFQKDLDSGKFKGLPGDKTKKDRKASMFKLMWSMKNKGDKPHYKPGVKDKLKSKYKEEVEMDEASVTGITLSRKLAGTTIPPKQAPRSKRMDKSKNLAPAPGWTTRKAGHGAGQMTTAEYQPEESNLPPHLSKFLDKEGNPNPEAAKRMAVGRKKREAPKIKDVTPKGYGPKEEVEIDEGPPTPKFKPLKHKVWSADASIPAGARPKNPGKIKKYKASGAMPETVTHFGDVLRQAIEEAKKVNAIDTINKIVKTKTMGKLHGQKVDLFTASAIQQVYNALNKKNQEKMISVMSKDVHGLLKMADFSMKQMKR